MILALVLIYAVTLLYMCSIERFRYYAAIIALQGWLLFFIAMVTSSSETSSAEHILIFAETSIVKGIVIPYMLFRIIKSTHVNHVHRQSMPPAVTVILALLSLAASVWLANTTTSDGMGKMIFGLSIFGILVGLILITTHRRIFSHLVGFLTLENSMFLFSITLGFAIPMLVNIAVTIDLLVGVLLLGFVINKVSERAGTLNSEKLSNLKD